MSVDYYVVVHQANWPTAVAVQACLARQDYPVRLAQAPAEPFSPRPGTLVVRFNDRTIELEASAVQLSPTVSYAYSFTRSPDLNHKEQDGAIKVFQMGPDDVFEPADIKTDLARLGAKGLSFGYGDHVLSLSIHGSPDEIRAGFYLMAAMIHCFGGYGFEFQGPSHGGRAYADGLVADAADDAMWTQRQPKLDDLRAALVAGEESGVSSHGFDEIFAHIQKSLRKPAP